jgi:hypothetical protein
VFLVWKILEVFADGAENCQINAGVVARRNESATAMTTRVVWKILEVFVDGARKCQINAGGPG